MNQVLIAGTIQPQQKRKSKVLWLVIGGILLLVIVVGMLSKSPRQSGAEDTVKKSSASAESVENARETQFPASSQIAPPTYRLYKSGTGEITTYVIPVATSDEQLKSLLWLFRVKVRTGDFKAIGITKPTAEQWGQYGYTSGMLVVYRGTKCANEGYISDAELEKGNIGACGYGEHDDAYYHWGIHADPYKDEAQIVTKDGDYAPVFDYNDNWHAPSEGLQPVSENTKKAWNTKQQEWEPRQQFAVAMANKLNEQGIAIDISANEINPDQIEFNSKLFQDSKFKHSFMTKILPEIHVNLCSAGFHSIVILQGNKSSDGRPLPLQCQ